MKITYEREISHCEVSPYIKEVTIKEISPAENSDFLEKILFQEIGWSAISKKGLHKIGDKVLFIPPESVLPFELSEEVEVTKYLAKGKVRVTRLRGNRSEGLILSMEKVKPYIPFILKWEDLPTIQMRGEALSLSSVNPHFIKFYKMPNILNEPYTFEKGEKIIWSEKIHGTNSRFGILQHPHEDKKEEYVGSHNIVLKGNAENIYWKIAKEKILPKIPYDIVFFGEIFGLGIQKNFSYGLKETDIKLFAATKNGEYLHNSEFVEICKNYDLPHVKFHYTKFESIEQVREIADQPSELTTENLREGIVITSLKYPHKMAKCLNFEYTTWKEL